MSSTNGPSDAYPEGLLLGKVNKGGRFVGQGMTAPAIYGVVLKYEKLKRFCANCNHGKGGTDKG